MVVSIYNKHYDEEIGPKVAEDVLWLGAIGCCTFCLLSFACFLKTIDWKYIPTFYSTEKGWEFTCANFYKATTDEAKFVIFNHHEKYFEAIEDELVVWLQDNWETWNANREPWFGKFTHKICCYISRSLSSLHQQYIY